jgi:hypothetical protein
MEEGNTDASSIMEEQSILQLRLSDVRDAVNRVKNGYQSYYGPASTNSTGCLIAAKTPNKADKTGWVKCKVGGGRKEYYIHHLALVNSKRGDELRGASSKESKFRICATTELASSPTISWWKMLK